MLVSRRPLLAQKRVRIVAPSSPFRAEHLAAGISVMQREDLLVDDASGVLQKGHPFLNGSDEERVSALMDALTSDVDAVWLVRGGYGLTRILGALREKLIEARPQFIAEGMPTVVGFSDATALFGLFDVLGLPSVHGPLATSLRNESEASVAHLFRVLADPKHAFELPCIPRSSLGDDEVRGDVFIANLCVLNALVGTPFMPDLDGRILILEEIGERPYRIDRMLTQLHDAGALTNVKAFATGHLTGCDERVDGVVKATADTIFAEWSTRTGIPWFCGLPVGHESPNFAIPQGAQVMIRALGSTARLVFAR
ncbi:MAG: LD-carboxypeptidase [Deltaproteobacteria bacterium]|nr:LD-carboxypeptidase [Deltaproteobacteria bacterium]